MPLIDLGYPIVPETRLPADSSSALAAEALVAVALTGHLKSIGLDPLAAQQHSSIAQVPTPDLPIASYLFLTSFKSTLALVPSIITALILRPFWLTSLKCLSLKAF